MLGWFSRMVVPAVVGCILCGPAMAQQAEQLRERINKGTVTVVTGGFDDSLIMSELAEELNLPGSIRILPLTGDGGFQNVADILYLRGIDMAVIESDTLALLKRRNLYPNLQRRVNIISKLYIEEIHLIANRAIKSIAELAGRRVNFGIQGSGDYERSQLLFQAVGVSPTPVALEPSDALERVKNGSLAATILVAPKPSTFLRQADLGESVHLLSIPFAGSLVENYVPVSITKDDYPSLIDSAAGVKTLGVSAVMAVYNWPGVNERSRKVENFVATFFENIQKMHAPQYHPKWKEVTLNAELPGWNRLQVAQRWLADKAAEQQARRQQEIIGETAGEGLRAEFRNFLSALEKSRTLQPGQEPAVATPSQTPAQQPVSDEALQNLFTDFLEWRREQTQ